MLCVIVFYIYLYIQKFAPPIIVSPLQIRGLLIRERALGEFPTIDFRHHSFTFFRNSSPCRPVPYFHFKGCLLHDLHEGLVPCMRNWKHVHVPPPREISSDKTDIDETAMHMLPVLCTSDTCMHTRERLSLSPCS